ncbi:hypothetical protein [Bacillus pseudomycoides]
MKCFNNHVKKGRFIYQHVKNTLLGPKIILGQMRLKG